jgi:hypothetical protein
MTLGDFTFEPHPVTTPGHPPSRRRLRPLVLTDRATGDTYIIQHDGDATAALTAFTPHRRDEVYRPFEEPTLRVGKHIVRAYVENGELHHERYPHHTRQRPILFGETPRPRPRQPRWRLTLPEDAL